jgi:acetate kinase
LTERFAAIQGRPASAFNLITIHLGNGCSACAVDHGQAVDSTMGMTPLEGLVMGTRPGDLDPAIVYRLLEWEKLDIASLDRLLNHKSGLLGISGLSNDMRELLDLEARGSEPAKLAIDVFCHRIRRYIGAFYGILNGADAIVFSGGIGENSPEVRARVCRNLDALGIALDEAANAGCRGREADLSAAGTRTRVWVIPTNEELLIARDTGVLIAGGVLGD